MNQCLSFFSSEHWQLLLFQSLQIINESNNLTQGFLYLKNAPKTIIGLHANGMRKLPNEHDNCHVTASFSIVCGWIISEISPGFFLGGWGVMLGMNENIYWGINEVLISYLENELFDKVIV